MVDIQEGAPLQTFGWIVETVPRSAQIQGLGTQTTQNHATCLHKFT